MNTYITKINYMAESLALLNVLAKPGPYTKEHMLREADKYAITPGQRQEEIVELIQQIEDEARNELAGYEEQISYYFKSEGDAEASFADILLVNGKVQDMPRKGSVEEYRTFLDKMTEDVYNREFYNAVFYYGSVVYEEKEDGEFSVADILNVILEKDWDPGEKIRLQELFLHHRQHFDKVFTLLAAAEKVLKKYGKKLEKYGQQTKNYLESTVGEESFAAYLLDKLYHESDDTKYPKDSEVYIQYIMCRLLGASIEGPTWDCAKVYGAVGVLYGSEFPINYVIEKKEMLNPDKAISILKLLADKSKFEILSITGDEEAYGAQLAEKLELTTATISHHLTALLKQDLLTVDKMGSRIYYRTNRETIKALIRYLEETLL